jgi:benzaldehyde dehydrogenase (NAD)
MSVNQLVPANIWRNRIYSGGWKAAGAGTIPVTGKATRETIGLANRNRYGLVAAVASSDLRRAQRIADRLHAGIVHINDQTVMHEVFAPMGGFGMSGNGHNYSTLTNADQFTEWQWLTSREDLPAYRF